MYIYIYYLKLKKKSRKRLVSQTVYAIFINIKKNAPILTNIKVVGLGEGGSFGIFGDSSLPGLGFFY